RPNLPAAAYALAVCGVKGCGIAFGTACCREICERRNALGSGAAACLPQVGSDQGLRAMRDHLLYRNNHHCCGLLSSDGEASLKFRIGADPRAPVYAVGFVRSRHEEDERDTGVFNEVLEAFNHIVASTVGYEQRPAVVGNRYKARLIALRRAIETFSASSCENQERRSCNKCPTGSVDVIKHNLDAPLDRSRVKRGEFIDACYGTASGVGHGKSPSVEHVLFRIGRHGRNDDRLARPSMGARCRLLADKADIWPDALGRVPINPAASCDW